MRQLLVCTYHYHYRRTTNDHLMCCDDEFTRVSLHAPLPTHPSGVNYKRSTQTNLLYVNVNVKFGLVKKANYYSRPVERNYGT